MAWVGPLAIERVIRRCEELVPPRARRVRAHDGGGWATLGTDRDAPVQTLPAPMPDHKALVAATCMRRFEMLHCLRGT